MFQLPLEVQPTPWQDHLPVVNYALLVEVFDAYAPVEKLGGDQESFRNTVFVRDPDGPLPHEVSLDTDWRQLERAVNIRSHDIVCNLRQECLLCVAPSLLYVLEDSWYCRHCVPVTVSPVAFAKALSFQVDGD